MNFDFDTKIDRSNTHSLKYDFAKERGKPDGILPLWVADMDFKSPQAVIETLTDRCSHGVFGYSDSKEDYFETLKQWFSDQYGFDLSADWLVKTPGVVYSIATAIRALTEKGDAVIIQQPVYYPFSSTVLHNDRKLVVNELLYKDGHYSIDFEDFEQKIQSNKVKLFILCSPHNPVGRVWTVDELTRLGDICVRHNVIILSDEIHADFVYPGHKHTVFPGIKPEFLRRCVLCTSPTKTFNLAGLQISNIFIADKELRQRFLKEIRKSGYSQPNVMGMIACQAAYDKGKDWLLALKEYLFNNLTFVREFLEENLPDIRLVEPEGTYLIWLDCLGLLLSDNELNDIIVNKAGLWLDEGTMFGQGGVGFQRINIACPRELLETAFTRLLQALT